MLFVCLCKLDNIYIYDSDDMTLESIPINDFFDYILSTSDLRVKDLGYEKKYLCKNRNFGGIIEICETQRERIIGHISSKSMALYFDYSAGILRLFDKIYHVDMKDFFRIELMYARQDIDGAIGCDGMVLCLDNIFDGYILCRHNGHIIARDTNGVECDLFRESDDYIINALVRDRVLTDSLLPYLTTDIRKGVLIGM